MQCYLYLSLIPESLIASQLPPEEFGSYYATGSRKRSRGQAIFFEVDSAWESDDFQLGLARERCVPHPDGRPKRSAYLSIYRVLERVPLSALKNLYLTTGDGRVLSLESAEFESNPFREHHLYQELCPVTPRVLSVLPPPEFVKCVTDPANAVHVHTMFFCELILNKLSRDPDSEEVGDLPYPNIGHLRDCMKELESKPHKSTKAVNRGMNSELLYRTIKNGFFVGNQDDFRFYPMPSIEQLEREYYEWWRSAQHAFGE